MTEEDKQIAVIASLPNDEAWCPFCFEKQRARATRFFLPDGKLSKMVRCCVCKAKMQAASMKILFEGPKTFGMFIGGYSRFWGRVDHDQWIKKLKQTFTKDQLSEFWDGYGDMRPEFKERRRQEQALRDYEAANRS